MFLREAPTETVASMSTKLDDGGETFLIPTGGIKLDRNAGVISVLPEGFRPKDAIRLPFSAESVDAIGNFLQIPDSFHKRLPVDLADHLVNELWARSHDPARVRISKGDEIVFMRPLNDKIIEPRRFLDIAASVISPDAPVIDLTYTKDFFGFDVVAPESLGRGTGGDPKVGDITRAGLRFGQNLREGLAPFTSRYMYRLICTNGMEMPDKTLKIDARGNTVDEVIAELEQMAQIAFAKVEEDMAHFYALRDQPVEHPERVMNRLAAEQRLSDRMRLSLIEAVPTIVPESGEVTMFDLVNLITNQANNPENRPGVRRRFETFGGTITSQHAERCVTCASKLN